MKWARVRCACGQSLPRKKDWALRQKARASTGNGEEGDHAKALVKAEPGRRVRTHFRSIGGGVGLVDSAREKNKRAQWLRDLHSFEPGGDTEASALLIRQYIDN